MRGKNEILLKFFGHGVAMLRFQEEQIADSVSMFVKDLGLLTQEFVIGNPATDVFLMLEEGHQVTNVDVRNTEDEWDHLISVVQSGGSDGFRSRVFNLDIARKSLSGDFAVS